MRIKMERILNIISTSISPSPQNKQIASTQNTPSPQSSLLIVQFQWRLEFPKRLIIVKMRNLLPLSLKLLHPINQLILPLNMMNRDPLEFVRNERTLLMPVARSLKIRQLLKVSVPSIVIEVTQANTEVMEATNHRLTMEGV